MTAPTTPEYARALVAKRAAELREAIGYVMPNEKDAIVHHRLCETICECEWCESYFDNNAEESKK